MEGPLMPVIRVAGSHRDVGRQIGAACADAVREAVVFADEVPRDGRSLEEQLQLAAEYRNLTARHLPYLVEELDAVAEAADVDPLRVFAASIEEIWLPAPAPRPRRTALSAERGRCSDLVVGPPSSADGDLLVAHNNDLAADVEKSVVAIDWRVDDEPRMFTIGIGPWISVGWNDSGLLLSGNELAPNDNRVGIPRLLLVREQLRATSMSSAIDAALHPDRASAYNTVFAMPDGDVADVEGSGTSGEVMGLAADGTLVHTNHYVCSSMLAYEDDPDYAQRSAVRLRRAQQLLSEAAAREPIDEGRLVTMLADHENAPDSLCRHPDDSTDTQTVFWAVTNVTRGTITFGRGNPCRSTSQSFSFNPS